MNTKTLKTNLGIEYDIEIVEIGVKNIVVNVTCEEGSKEFLLTYDFPLKEDNAFYGQVINNDCTQITNDDLVEAEKWVNDITVRFIASEFSSICLSKNIPNDEYWQFGMFTLDALGCSVHRMNLVNNVPHDCKESFFANGEQEIKELINKLK